MLDKKIAVAAVLTLSYCVDTQMILLDQKMHASTVSRALLLVVVNYLFCVKRMQLRHTRLVLILR